MSTFAALPPLLRLSQGVAVAGLSIDLVFGALGGQWMRWGTVILGAAFLPFAALILTNFRGECAELTARLRKESWKLPPERLALLETKTFRYGFGLVFLLVGILFLVVGIQGGPGVTKPGGLF
jgi:hypothetical protein